MKSGICTHFASLSKLGRLTAGLVTLSALAACGGSIDSGVNEIDASSSEQAMSPSLTALGNLAGRYSGEIILPKTGLGLTKETRKVGLLIEQLPDGKSYLAIVIRYTNFFKDNFPQNLGKGIDRVVERVSIYRAVPKMDTTAVLKLEPVVYKNGEIVATETNGQLQLSELRISPKPTSGIGGTIAALRNKASSHQAEITVSASGEPIKVQFNTFLKNADVPTSTWDRDFIADTWESTYFIANPLATTALEQGQMMLDVTEKSSIKGKYKMTEVSYRASAQSKPQKVTGLYAMSPADGSASNPLASRLGVFIDVVNRKNLGFKTRELFLVDPNSDGAKFDEVKKKDGFIMYFQKDFMGIKPR
jgi:hypothetical protein